LIGRKFNDPIVKADMRLWPFKVVEGSQSRSQKEVTYKGEKTKFFAEAVSSMVLVRMKETAEAYCCNKVSKAVITVPAYFNYSQ